MVCDDSYLRQQLGLQFESLGGGGLADSGWGFGCEFGFFQRDRCKVDPLGLLRWASISPDGLIAMLKSRLEGLVCRENIQLHSHNGYWHLKIASNDTSIRIDHTNLNAELISKPDATEMLVKKYTFLAEKLLNDLQAGEKIFVYRTFDHTVDEEKLHCLAEAVNSFGRNILLYVQEYDEQNAPFTVIKVHGGLMRGYIDYFAPQKDGLRSNYEGWERVCRSAIDARERYF